MQGAQRSLRSSAALAWQAVSPTNRGEPGQELPALARACPTGSAAASGGLVGCDGEGLDLDQVVAEERHQILCDDCDELALEAMFCRLGR